MLHKKQLLSLLITSTFVTPAISTAAEQVALDDLVVTASRTNIPAVEALSSVSIITREDIEKYQYQTLAEALNSLPGVTISNSGGLGKQTSLFLRGTESNHTQILLNGTKLATNEFGAPQLEYIPLDTIERIELVRGPQSGLYGSSSIGGTIQIFTRGASEGVKPYGSIAYGTHNTKKAQLGLSASNEAAWINMSGGYTRTDGFDSCNSTTSGCYADEPDRDGYKNKNSSIRAGINISNDTDIEVFSLYSDGDTYYDGYYNETEFTQHTYGLSFDTFVTDIWQLQLKLSQAKLETDTFGTATSSSDNDKDMLSLQSNITLFSDHVLTVGYDYEDDEYKSSSSSTTAERNNHGYFAQLQGGNERFDYRVTARHDDNEQYGNNGSGNVAWGIKFNDSLRSYISYGEAFTAPGFIDLDPAAYGNPDLLPEESDTVEVGLTGAYDNFAWSAAVYKTDIKNLIALDSFWVPQNIDKATIKGLELTAKTTLLDIDWSGQLSLMQPENRSDDSNKGNVLARRAEQTFSLNANKTWNKFSLATKLYFSGRRYDDAANSRRLSSFTTVDMVAGYQITTATAIQLKVANLFDKQYETVSGYNTDGTNLLLSISYYPQ